MKLKKVSRTFNTYVVQKLKKLKIKTLKDKMPSEKMYDGKDIKLQTVLSNGPTTEITSTATPTLDVTTTTKLSNNMKTTEHYSSSPTRQKSTVPIRRTANDFRFGKAIGEGSFSTVYLTKDIHTNKEYAIKVCEKSHIIREKKQEYIKREREVMHRLINCPGFVNLSCTFQDTKSLYFVMTYAKNGDLLPYINRVGSFDMDCTRYYAAELVLALEQMHKRGIIHRDLKPENILLDEKMHTLIADFGSAKLLTQTEMSAQSLAKEDDDCGGERKRSFVGTAQYVSPEILKGTPTSRSTDLWALGCIMYQMISGLPPFRAATEYLIFQKVLKLDYKFPDGFDKTAKDLVEKLLQLDPEERLGFSDEIAEGIYTSIRTHPFFKGIDFANLRQQRPPQIHPFLPATSGTADDLHSQYCVPDHLEPGLGDRQLNRLMGLELGTAFEQTDRPDRFSTTTGEVDLASKNFLTKPASEIQRLLDLQKHDKWHQFVDGELILKKGLVNKRKGLFARKRMLLLTTGPRLIYVDPVNMVKKGEIPWTADLKVEPKNFKIFFVHTPNRTYYLEDPEGFALNWCKAIDDVRKCTNKYISTEILCFSSFETNVPQVREILENKCSKQIFIS